MNQYDNEKFFEQYSHMARSERGLAGAGEWHELERMLPRFCGKGCAGSRLRIRVALQIRS